MVKEGRERFKETVQLVLAAAFGLIRFCGFRSRIAVKIQLFVVQCVKFVFFLYGAGPARTLFAKAQLVEHVGGTHQPRPGLATRKQGRGLTHHLFERGTGHPHGPNRLA